MLAAALEAEVAAYVEAHADERDQRGRRLVVRNGHAEPRTITTGAGPIEIDAPRVNDRRVDEETGERCRFRSSIIPPWCRTSPKERLCCLVVVGVRVDGTKELVAIADGYRESTDSWADVLRDLRSRGMGAPVLAVGDGALGFWAAPRDVWPETRTQRCWVHKVANVLSALPKATHRTARRMLAEIRDAEDRDHALQAVHAFANEFGAKWPKAVAKIVDDLAALLAFYDFPAEHWIHLKTTNPISVNRPCEASLVAAA